MGTTVKGTLAYLGVTLPVGVVWHLVLFKDAYERMGLYRKDPIFPLGIASILIQGVILSSLYPRVRTKGGSAFGSALRFCLTMGAFFASGTVVAHAAKAAIPDLGAWFGYNLAFTLLHFTLVAAAFAAVFGSGEEGER